MLDRFTIAFSTRKGGVSEPPYSGLNTSLYVGDDPQAVILNRLKLFGALGLGTEVVVPCQVHGTSVFVAEEGDAGRGVFEASTAVPTTDSLVTDRPGLALLCLFADCVPIAVADPVRRAVGIVHAGWRGTAGGIVNRTVEVMRDAFSSKPGDLVAVIGPAIGACCYEVGDEVAGALMPIGEGIAVKVENGKWSVDLAFANMERLLSAGLSEKNVFTLGICTACEAELFFSHRRDRGRTGRMAAVVCVR